jgi:N-acetylglucosaminyldiphosphoundecaprenol N-acetyl-beta-D-mannosaminyltransferase
VAYIVKGIQGTSDAVAGSVTQWPRAKEEAHGWGVASTGADCGVDWNSAATIPDDLSREVYCILGMPIDAIEMPAVLRSIDAAATNESPFLISTPNLNWLVNTQQDLEFRESVLLSDLCLTDGMPIVWIARLMGLPIQHRIAGSSILEALKTRPRTERPLKVFLFGSTESVATAAAKTLNADPAVLTCVGWICPGFGTVQELSANDLIESVNSSEAHFLVAALGAKKGQLWLQRNHDSLRIPIRAHLGATINFQAGVIKRAPRTLQKLGLEWVWRIKEEPRLWSRYWNDGLVLLRLMATHVLPLALEASMLRRRCERNGHDLIIKQAGQRDHITLGLSGFAIASHTSKAILCFREVMATKKQITIDLSETCGIDARFFGLLLMVRKQLKAQGSTLKLTGISRKIARAFRLHGLEHLLPSGRGS